MRRRTRSRAMAHAHCCENPLTTFTNEQAVYLGIGGLVAAGVFGWLLYNAGKNVQQIADLQALQAGTFGQTNTTAGG